MKTWEEEMDGFFSEVFAPGKEKVKVFVVCRYCGGLVRWMGPRAALTHTECEKCNATNSQEEVDDVRDDEETQSNEDEDGTPVLY